jgi:hypothetical protein
METKLEQIAVKAVNQLPKSAALEIRTPTFCGSRGRRLRRPGGWREILVPTTTIGPVRQFQWLASYSGGV